MNETHARFTIVTLVSFILAGCGTTATAPAAEATVRAAMGAAPGTSPEAPIPLKVGFTTYMSYSPLYFAQAEGYFADEGLDVELVNFPPTSPETVPAMAAGDLDVAAIGVGAAELNAISQGINLKIVADKGYMNPEGCSSDGWVASEKALAEGLEDPTTLKGRSIVQLRESGPVYYAFERIFASSGITTEDIETAYIADPPSRIEALANGTVDVAPLSEPWISYVEAEGIGKLWIPYSQAIPWLSLGNIVFGPSILDENPEAGYRFMTAYVRAARQFNEGKSDRNVELISEFTRLSPEEIRRSCWNSISVDGGEDTDAFLEFQQWLYDKGYVDQVLPLDQIWTDDYIVEASRRLGP